jgi:hypothetical protein
MTAHIYQALNEGSRVIDATLVHMSIDTLRKLQTHVTTTKDEQTKIDFLARFIFSQDFSAIEHTNKAMKLSEAAIKSITTVKFYENYLDRHGRLSWDNYRDNLDKAIRFVFVCHGVPCR